MKKFLCISLSPTLQKTITFEKVQLEKVNRSEHYRMDASGKGANSARVLAQLEDGCVKTFCPLGRENAEEFIKLTEKDKINLSYILIDGKIRECCTLLDRTNKTTTELVVGEAEIERTTQFINEENNFLSKLEDEIKTVDAVLLAGSHPKVWKPELYSEIAQIALKNGKIFLADYIGSDLTLTLEKCTPTIIKINDEEFCKTFGMEFVESDNAAEMAKYEDDLKNAICKKSNELQNIIVVTRGYNPTFAAKNGDFISCPTEKVDAVNTTACGDSFNSGFLYEYTNSGNFDAALKKGTWCAARNAERECAGSVR